MFSLKFSTKITTLPDCKAFWLKKKLQLNIFVILTDHSLHNTKLLDVLQYCILLAKSLTEQ